MSYPHKPDHLFRVTFEQKESFIKNLPLLSLSLFLCTLAWGQTIESTKKSFRQPTTSLPTSIEVNSLQVPLPIESIDLQNTQTSPALNTTDILEAYSHAVVLRNGGRYQNSQIFLRGAASEHSLYFS